jgi:hypothetical protein
MTEPVILLSTIVTARWLERRWPIDPHLPYDEVMADWKATFVKRLSSDRRGVAAMEFGILGGIIILLSLPIADVAAAAITYIRAYQAMRNVAAWTQYNPPPDLTTPATWPRLANIPVMSGFVVTRGGAMARPGTAGVARHGEAPAGRNPRPRARA